MPRALDQEGLHQPQEVARLVSTNPAAALGLAPVAIEVGRPLTASLRRVQQFSTAAAENGAHVGMALWRDGQLVFSRNPSGTKVLAH